MIKNVQIWLKGNLIILISLTPNFIFLVCITEQISHGNSLTSNNPALFLTSWPHMVIKYIQNKLIRHY